jgi:hypothetical protein
MPPFGVSSGLVLPGGGGPVIPKSGLTLWLDGRTGITPGSTFEWADQSGNNNNFTNGTAGHQPVTGGDINGQNALTYTQSPSKGLVGPALSALIAPSTLIWTFAAVFQCNAALPFSPVTFPQFACEIFGATNTGVTQWTGVGSCVDPSDSTQLYIYAMQWDGAQKAVFNHGANSVDAHFLIATYDGTDLNLSVDGGSVSSAAAGSTTLASVAASTGGFDGNSTVQAWSNLQAQILAWDRVLSPTEQAAVFSVMSGIYGL